MNAPHANRPGQRLYFATIGLLGLWVGLWGTLAPTQADRALPWLVPPLHARFLGAVYLSAALMLAAGLGARRQAEVWVMTLLITLWTGLLMVLSLFHLDAFDWHHTPVWFWFGAYALYPVVGFWSLRRHGGPGHAAQGPAFPRQAGQLLGLAGACMVGLALLLLAAPGAAAQAWPWKISPLLAQIYSAPFAAYGVSFLLLRRGRTWPEARIVVRGGAVFTALVLVASVLHRAVFDPGRVATWVWFGAFAAAFALLVGLELRSRRWVERA